MQIALILLNILLISFSCIGYHLAGYEGYLLEGISKYFREKEKGFIYKLGMTIINCPRCQASLHTLVFSPLILQYFISVPVWLLVSAYILVSIGAIAFMNSVLINWFEKFEDKFR